MYFSSSGTSSIIDRAPRKNDTQSMAVCNDGDKWFFSIGGSNTNH